MVQSLKSNAGALRTELQENIVQGYRLFAALGWGDLGDGHISGRDPTQPDAFWLLNSQTAFSKATTQDLVLVNGNGKTLDGDGEASLPAYYIHYPILRARDDITSVAHTHTHFGTPFSAEARQFEAITQESCIFVDDHAIFDDEMVQVQDLETGRRIAESLERHRGLILRNHGLLTVGKSARESVVWFVMMERVAEAHLKVKKPQPISHNAALYAKGDLATDGQVEHAFKHLVQHHLN